MWQCLCNDEGLLARQEASHRYAHLKALVLVVHMLAAHFHLRCGRGRTMPESALSLGAAVPRAPDAFARAS